MNLRVLFIFRVQYKFVLLKNNIFQQILKCLIQTKRKTSSILIRKSKYDIVIILKNKQALTKNTGFYHLSFFIC